MVYEYDEAVLKSFIENQGQLFSENIADTPEAAEEFLKQSGMRILEKNFRCRQGEIDIIGLQDGILIFFEVKYRKNTRKGYS